MGSRAVPLLLVLTTVAACSSSSSSAGVAADAGGGDSSGPDATTLDASGGLAVTVHAVVDLPRTSATRALSATAFDPATRTLYALQDTSPTIVPLVANDDFTTFAVGAPLSLTGRPDPAWDGEGLVRDGGGFVAVTVETTPTIEQFDGSGKRTGAIATPPRFANQAPGNKGIESLTVSPSGRYLFAANESALTTDGVAATKSRGTTVRILRRELATGIDIETAYRTEPLGEGGATGDMGVSELAALSDDAVLVLERGYQPGYGNTVRIFRVDVTGAERVGDTPSLDDTTPALAKTLVVDLGALPAGGVTHPSTQPNPILDNYEALGIGPRLSSGEQLLFVTSDDNASATQVARVLVLAVRGL